ncbi:MAG: GntR family transcriptional regulator [Janthinobacterium lividum]
MLAQKIRRVAKRATMQETIYMDLRRSLMHGHFEPGHLLTIQALADEFGCSTMPVREALRQLSVENGLNALPNGTIQVPRVTHKRLQDLFAVRVKLEDMATALACEQMDEALLRRLRRLIDEHELAIKHDGVYPTLEKNLEFHFLIYNAAGSEVLSQLIETTWLQFGPYMRVMSRHIEESADTAYLTKGIERHRQLLDALERGDVEGARLAMQADIRETYELLNTLLSRKTVLQAVA